MQLSTVADRRIHTPLRQQSTSLAVRSDRRRLQEVSVAEREQPDSLSMLLTTRWMNQYVWELQFYFPVFFVFCFFLLTHTTTTLGHAPKCWYWLVIYRERMWNFLFSLVALICTQSISARQFLSQSRGSICAVYRARLAQAGTFICHRCVSWSRIWSQSQH